MALADRLFLDTPEPLNPEIRDYARQENPGLFQPQYQPLGNRFASRAQQPSRTDQLRSYAGPLAGGLESAAQAGTSYDMPSALVNVGTSTLGGAATGFMLGGPIGAAVGGGVGLVSSGLQAWLGVSAENKRRREIEKFQKQVEAKREKEKREAKFERTLTERKEQREAAIQQRWAKTSQYRNQIQSLIASDKNMRQRFIQTGVR